MRQCVRGLAAVVGGATLAVGMVGGAAAVPSGDEVTALYEFRTQLVESPRDVKAELAEYRAHRVEIAEALGLDLGPPRAAATPGPPSSTTAMPSSTPESIPDAMPAPEPTPEPAPTSVPDPFADLQPRIR